MTQLVATQTRYLFSARGGLQRTTVVFHRELLCGNFYQKHRSTGVCPTRGKFPSFLSKKWKDASAHAPLGFLPCARSIILHLWRFLSGSAGTRRFTPQHRRRRPARTPSILNRTCPLKSANVRYARARAFSRLDGAECQRGAFCCFQRTFAPSGRHLLL